MLGAVCHVGLPVLLGTFRYFIKTHPASSLSEAGAAMSSPVRAWRALSTSAAAAGRKNVVSDMSVSSPVFKPVRVPLVSDVRSRVGRASDTSK